MTQAQPQDGLFKVIEDENGTRVLPSKLAGGPWNPAHQHGGPVAGLLTRSIELIESPVPMRLSRLTVEMFRGVPLTPLRIETRVLRAGRRIQSVEANLFDGDVQVARATGLRMRTDDSMSMVATRGEVDPEFDNPPDRVPPMVPREGFGGFPGFINAVDFVRNESLDPTEPPSLWVRLRCRLVEGEETTPIQRLATVSDFASGTGNDMDFTKYTSINPDLTVHIVRAPRSDWLGIRGRTLRAIDGIGQSTATIHDLEGPIATGQACLLLDRR
jgi:hypothetical protein